VLGALPSATLGKVLLSVMTACSAAAEACKSSWTSSVCCVYVVANLLDLSWQAAAFANHVASSALTSEFAAKRQRLEGRIERLQTQHTEAVRDKSAAENKSRRLTEKLAAAEAEKEDLSRQLAVEKKDANRACAEAQAARAEIKLARAEANLARQRAEEAEASHSSLRDCLDKAEASTRAEVDRTHTQLADAYR
jgi:chromosome segregation ATPase